jgi:tetratricopeptide (TPR) repeat protein
MPWADEVERRFLAGDFDAVADQLRHPRPAPGSPAPGPATVLRLRARFARHCLQPRRAVRYLQAASAAARRSGDRAEEVRCLGELAEAASLFAHHEVSRQALLRLESLIPRSVDQTSGAWLSLSRGAFHLARREVPLARECFEEAVSRATAAGDREVAAESLFRLASAHAREDDFEPAQAAAEGRTQVHPAPGNVDRAARHVPA